MLTYIISVYFSVVLIRFVLNFEAYFMICMVLRDGDVLKALANTIVTLFIGSLLWPLEFILLFSTDNISKFFRCSTKEEINIMMKETYKQMKNINNGD